jgi:cytochrome c-type biogenesis protein
MIDAPLGLAIAAGMLAALNPCGFAMLPAYLTLIITGGPDGRGRAVGRALTMSGAMTLGFVVVFGAFGAIVVPLALSLERYLPWATIVIGIALIGLGAYLLTGREVLLRTPKVAGAAPEKTLRSMVVYGLAYAVASLSCTIGPFLALTTSTFRTENALAGMAVFITYAIGMGLVVAVLAVAVALARDGVVRRFRNALPYVTRASGLLLVLAGAYVAYYGWYEVRVFGGGATEDPIIGAATEVQGTVAQWVAQLSPWAVLGVLVALVALGTGSSWWRGSRASRSDQEPTPAAEDAPAR